LLLLVSEEIGERTKEKGLFDTILKREGENTEVDETSYARDFAKTLVHEVAQLVSQEYCEEDGI
jgi:hypothetical protein